MEIHKVQINELISPEYNPRTITSEELEKLKDSLEEFGYISPLIGNSVPPNLMKEIALHIKNNILNKVNQ